MAVSSGLSRALLGLGQGYMNARNQGRRERQNLITTNARLKSDRQRNAIEMAKLTSLDEDRADRRRSDAAAAKLKQEEFRQKTLGDVGLEMDRGMKRLEGRTGAELDTGIHQLRGNIMNLFGATPDRPYGLTQDQLDRSLAAPGSIIPGVFERKIGAGNLVNPDYGNDPTTQFYDPQSIQEIYGEDTPQVGQSMATRPEGSRNFLEFSNTPIDNQTKDIMGMMGQGAYKYLGGQMAMPQDFGDMMSMKPGGTFRSPEDIQKAVKSGIPDSVMISREREATPKDVPMRAKYGMKETDLARIDQQKASAAASTSKIQIAERKLQPEIDLMIARTRKFNTDIKLAPFKAAAAQASTAMQQARLNLAALKENNLMIRHGDMMAYRGTDMERKINEERALNVRSVFTSMGDLQKSLTMAAQAKAALEGNPNFDSKSPQGKQALKDINDMMAGMQKNIDDIQVWGATETGSPLEQTNIGMTGAYLENQGFVTDNPQLGALGSSMRNRPGLFASMGTRYPYEVGRASGLYQGVDPAAAAFAQRFGGREPDSGGMAGAAGARPTGGGAKQTGGASPTVGKPKPAGGGPKPTVVAPMTREQLLKAHMDALKGGK
jgi:hypothetical protein